MGSTKKWVKLGNIGRPHGVRGGFFIGDRTGLLDLSVKGKALFCGEDPEVGGRYLTVGSQKTSAGRTVLHFTELSYRDQIEAIKGQSLFITRAEIGIDDSQEYLWDELVGLRVVDCNNQDLGVAERVSNFGASDILSIRHSSRGRLELPLVESYFDMSLGESSDKLQLIVSLDLFSDCWETP